MNDTYQLYDEQGRPKEDRYVTKDDIFKKGELHGASHVWIWRIQNDAIEVLLQKRSPEKRTWPNRYDISAAGHINAGEEPLVAALRETKEEIGTDVKPEELTNIGVRRAHMVTSKGLIENEFQWLYLLRMEGDPSFVIQDDEVASLLWKTIDQIRADLRDAPDTYVPHATLYYDTVLHAIESAAKN